MRQLELKIDGVKCTRKSQKSTRLLGIRAKFTYFCA